MPKNSVRSKIAFIVLLSLALASSVLGAGDLMITIKNAGLSRTVSAAVGILKTTKLEANGVQALDGPSVEFMLDMDYKGKSISLVPSDFDVIGSDRIADGRETRTSVELRSHYEGIPVAVYVNYYSLPDAGYQQKSISVTPCKEAAGAVLKRVVIDYCRLKGDFFPLVPNDGFSLDGTNVQPVADVSGDFTNGRFSNFAAMNHGKKTGFFFSVGSRRGSVGYAWDLFMAEQTDTPLEKGFESARATIGAVAGGSTEALYRRYREFVVDNGYPNVAKRLPALRKRYKPYFDTCRFIRVSPSAAGLEAEGHIADGRGFVILCNSSDTARKVDLRPTLSRLNLPGDWGLTDWTTSDSPVSLGVSRAPDKAEIEVLAGSAKVIGINVAP